jgi:hypothetical protein
MSDTYISFVELTDTKLLIYMYRRDTTEIEFPYQDRTVEDETEVQFRNDQDTLTITRDTTQTRVTIVESRGSVPNILNVQCNDLFWERLSQELPVKKLNPCVPIETPPCKKRKRE